MRLLLDAHALLWWLDGARRLTAGATEAIADPRNIVVVSAASIWELEIKRSLGRLDAPTELVAAIGETGFEQLHITGRHATDAARLPRHHDDPFDRMLVAQAQAEGLTLVTRDRRLADYEVALLPA